MDHLDVTAEFDRQVHVLVEHGYPTLAGLTEAAFRDLVDPLREEAVRHSAGLAAPTRARVPFVLVIQESLVPAADAVALTALADRKGRTMFEPDDIASFTATAGLGVPDRPAYLALDLDRDTETLNVSPDDALPGIIGRGRTPITVAEGIAFLTQYPQSLEKNDCYMLAGSRCGDRRVPALWISDRAPKLGWCWAGNRHTWLGIASCAGRQGG